MKRFAIFIAAGILSVSTVCGETRVERIRRTILNPDTTTVIVTAHRADWRNFPENSIEGIESAIAMGADIVELDVKPVADGTLIIMHDHTLDRTTTGTGKVADATMDYIRGLRLRNGVAIRTAQCIPTLEEVLHTVKDRVMVNIDGASEYFNEIWPLLQATGTVDHVIMKGSEPVETVRARYGERLDSVIYMPIVNLDSNGAMTEIDNYLNVGVPAFELLYRDDSNPLPQQLPDKLKGKARIWYNTLWDTMAGGHDDDRSLKDINDGYGYLVDSIGATMIQTDRPALLIEWLRSRHLHE